MDRHDTLLLACGTTENRKKICSIMDERYNLLETANTQQTILLLQQNIHCIAAVLLDITVPRLINKELLQEEEITDLFRQVPVILITPDDSPASLQRAYGHGAADVLPINYNSYAMLHRIENIIELSQHKRHLESMVKEQADILRHSNENMVDALSSIIEYRSVESGQHILRIRHFTKLLLEEVVRCCPEYGLTDTEVQIISSAAALHDIGKIAIPDAILTKPGKLTKEEMDIMKGHSLTGSQILHRLDHLGNEEYLRYAHNICLCHHERWDGGGYPMGLAGDDIPICAQVVGLADVYDALTTKRVYKDAYSFDTAVNMILNGECGVFSPKLLECFKNIKEKYEALARAYADCLDPETERFNVELPIPSATKTSDSMERLWVKYQSLVHYIGGFLMEINLDTNTFHVIYNPYPDLVSLHNISTLSDIRDLLMTNLVVPEQRQDMALFLRDGVNSFLADGLRRTTRRFRIRSRSKREGEDFDFTLLHTNSSDRSRRTLALLCHKVGQEAHSSAKEHELPLPAGISYTCRYDDHFTLLQLGSLTGEISGYTYEDLQKDFGGRLIELVVPEDREMLRREFREQLSQGNSVVLEHRVRARDGQTVWVTNRSRLAIDSNGQEYLYCILMDVTSIRQAMEDLSRKLEQYEIILDQTENVLFQWDIATDTISFSDTWKKVFGYMPVTVNFRDELLGGAFFHPDEVHLLIDRFSNLEKGSPYEMAEVRVVTAMGRYLWCRIRATSVRDEEGKLTKIVGVIINIEAEKKAEWALQDQADRDSLTKLLNKGAGRRYAEEYFRRFAQNLNCALMIIDLDDFKLVNDRYGHLFGDSVLTRTAKEIKKLFRNQDIVARIGGDEFMVLMRGISDRNLVENRCRQLLYALRSAFQSQPHQLHLGCSIGVALGPAHGRSYFDLYERADRALYQAKGRGKNSYVFYDPSNPTPRASSRRATQVSNRIDSDEQPGLANGNLVQYAFQRLYSSRDVHASINGILEMVGRQLNVSRVYIFENSPDNRFCSNTYEWCNDGIRSEIQKLQDLSYETDIPGYADNFDEEGIFYCPDTRELPQRLYDRVASQGVKSLLHCAIMDGGVFRGFIGFDECVNQRLWTKEQIQIVTYFSEMLSVFLLKEQEHKRSVQRATDLATILNNQNAWIYIIDPDTCELKYLNTKTHQLAPDVTVGMCCHQALMGCAERCRNCPALDIRNVRSNSAVMKNEAFHVDALAEATLIQWNGKEYCLMTCRDLRGEPKV